MRSRQGAKYRCNGTDFVLDHVRAAPHALRGKVAGRGNSCAVRLTNRVGRWSHVRFGSKADICSATTHVRFTPNSDRKSGLPQKILSALPPKADSRSAATHVRYGPKADMCSAKAYVCSSRARWNVR